MPNGRKEDIPKTKTTPPQKTSKQEWRKLRKIVIYVGHIPNNTTRVKPRIALVVLPL